MKPKTIIAAGLDVEEAVVISQIGNFKHIKVINQNQVLYLQNPRVVIISHPSRAYYQKWKNNKFNL